MQENIKTAEPGSRPQWSRLGFIFAASGSAIGLGNIVFFGANAYRFGGGAFYVPYFVALFVLGIPMMISDGKSEMQRFPSLDLAGLMDRVVARRDLYRTNLAEGEGQIAVTSASIMQGGTPDYDPVTG